MKTQTWKTVGFTACLMCVLGLTCGGQPAKTEAAGAERPDYAATKMLRKGMALLEDRQEERAVKVISAVPLNFPKSTVRFKAALLLGRHYTDKGDHQVAINNLESVAVAEDAEPDERAEALYRIGVAYYGLSDYGRALKSLRQATEDYPWSVFANEAYYYIGLCHFRMSRWRHAVEALKMVGTSVPNAESQTLVESGQRFFVKVEDKDLRVLKNLEKSFVAQVSAQSGDKESVTMEVFDDEGEAFLGSVKTALGAPAPGDGLLQVKGGDLVNVVYTDANTLGGELAVKRLGTSRMVSTAIIGFMDGAFREYVQGAFAGQNTFIRVKDFDADATGQKDKVKIRLYSRYRILPLDEEAVEVGTLEDEQEYAIRDELELWLEETAPHSGIFTVTIVIEEAEQGNKADNKLNALAKDSLHMEYVDKEHVEGLDDPRTVTARAEFLTGRIQDVWIAHREVDKEDLRARKNIVEAKFYLKLAQIFKDVGLTDRAADKADIGIEKVEDVLRRSMKASLNREHVEHAYQLKWELLLAKGDLNGAINACRTLMALYPASSVADVALLQIAKAKLEAKKTQEALQVLRGVLGLKGSKDLKAEAQFLIGQVLEENAEKGQTKQSQLRAMGQAIQAYKTCADQYPDSPFAGESLGKVVDFYIDSRDYDRSLEMLQTVFVDHPDAGFLDQMLLKWGTVLARTKRYEEARDKFQELLNDYPNSNVTGTARKLLKLVNRRLGKT